MYYDTPDNMTRTRQLRKLRFERKRGKQEEDKNEKAKHKIGPFADKVLEKKTCSPRNCVDSKETTRQRTKENVFEFSKRPVSEARAAVAAVQAMTSH